MKDQTDYEIEKQKKKQQLVRNEFLYHKQSAGKYDFPVIKKQNIDVDKIEFLSYVDTKIEEKENRHKTIHFFTYDWKFEKVYDEAEKEVEKLGQYFAVLSPDFSIFTNMPLALQIESVFKNRWCGAYWQSQGLKVIPTVSWGDKRTFDFCFDGIEEGSVVCVCTYYRENCEEEFMLGYNEMLKRIKPSLVLCYDEPFKSMTGNIKEFLPTTYEWTKNLNWKDLVQFKWEKHNKNICGLNPKNFKYFKYDDPYAKNIIGKCDVCGNIVMHDEFGNGECNKCGWLQEKLGVEYPERVIYPNIVSLNKAKKLYEEGKNFKPDIDDFVEGLKQYGEMEFKYRGNIFVVFRYTDYFEVVFDADGISFEKQTFKTYEDFINKANINGRLLKDIWSEIENPYYMS